MESVTVFSPAKINLFLAVTGRRLDGFHDLLSVVVPVDFGDDLVVQPGADGFTLTCDDPAVPLDESNLVLRAARAFAAATGWSGGAAFALTKRIPPGAGLGGGSSNAVATLKGLNRIAGGPLAAPALAEVAAALGSDCALFLADAPVVMRGRGEIVELLPAAVRERLHGRRLLLFKPGVAVSTPWAYQRMVRRGSDYRPAPAAEGALAAWTDGSVPLEDFLFNNMEPAVFEKFVALPVLARRLRAEFGLAVHMSGSGSACFALLGEDQVTAPVAGRIRECWGPGAFVREARVA